MADKFYGVKITDATGDVYTTEVEVHQDIKHKINQLSQQPLDSKFPYHTIIGNSCYWSGTVTAAFENNQDGECERDYTLGDAEFRLRFIEWLHNGLTKELILSDQFSVYATILEEISADINHTVDDSVMKTTFSWEADSDRFTSTGIPTCISCSHILSRATNFCPHCGTKVN